MEELSGRSFCGKLECIEEPLVMENTAYSKTTTTAIKLALNNASKNDEVLRQTFAFFSLITSESVPVEVVVNFVKTRSSGYTEALIRTKMIKSSLINYFYDEKRTPKYLRLYNMVHRVLQRHSTSNCCERVWCVSEAIRVFYSLTESECDHLLQSGEACEKLRKVTAHCRALFDTLTDTLQDKVTLTKELQSIITPSAIILWLSTKAAVCCDLSKFSDAYLFPTSACEIAENSDKSRENHEKINQLQQMLSL